MARLKRGKGKRSQVIEIVQLGEVLRHRETDAGDERLPGYRRFATSQAAQAALVAEVLSLIESGMQAADDEAREIAAAAPTKPAGPPAFPIRQDLGIYNEATGFVVTSRRMAGKTLDDGSSEWQKAVGRGDLLPMSLMQDDPFIIRIVAGDALTPEETAASVARVDGHINVSDGKLCVTGGSVFANEDYEDDDPHLEQYVAQVLIPKGRYRASLSALARGLGDPAEWSEDDRGDEDERVDFLLHLELVDEAPKTGLTALPKEGWFAGTENARTAGGAGVPAHNVIRARENAPGQWTYVWPVFEQLPKMERQPVTGDAVTLPLDALATAARIAWFGSRFTLIELRLTAPSGTSLDLAREWPEGVVAAQEDGVGRIRYDKDVDVNEVLERMPALAARLGGLADGTVLDLVSVVNHVLPGSPEGAGTIGLRGQIRSGAWRIAQAYPEVDGATLNAALAFVAAQSDPVRAIGPFADRFSGAWPIVTPKPVAQDADEDEGDGMFPTTPIKGAEIFVAPSARAYHATMALLVSEKVAAEVQKRERKLFAAGFKHVGDLVCSASEKVAFRGYTKAGGHAWAFYRVSAPSDVALEIATRYAGENDSSVTPVESEVYLNDRLAQHDETVEVLTSEFGAPVTAEATLRNFAETIEAVLLGE
jgi:hypothetical protein